MPGDSKATVPLVDGESRARRAPRGTGRNRRPGASPADLLAYWNRPDAWRWLEGRWAVSGTVMGVPFAPPGDTLRLTVEPVGVSYLFGTPTNGSKLAASPRSLVVFGDQGHPMIELADEIGGPATPLRAIAATRRAITFQDVLTASNGHEPGRIPPVLSVTLRRSGQNVFHIVGTTGVGASPVPLLTYTALKLNARG